MKNKTIVRTVYGRCFGIALFYTCFILFFTPVKLYAATITVTSNSNWSALGTTPTSSDSVIVKKNVTLTVNVTNAVCKAIQLGDNTGGANKGTGTLTFASTGSPVLTVSGKVYLGDGTKAGILTMVSGATLKCRGFGITTTTGNSYTSNGNIELQATNTLPATIITSFDTLIINHSSGTTTMGVGLTINGKLTMTSGLISLGANTLTLSGDFSGSSTNAIKGGSTSNITVNGSGTLGDLYFDQSNDGTTNVIATFTMNRSSQTAALGNKLQVSTSLTLTSGKFDIKGQTLVLNGDFSGSSSNCLVGSNTSNLSIGGSGTIGNLYFDPTSTSDTSLYTLTVNRSGQTVTLGNKLKIDSLITPTNGTLASGGFLYLESTSALTARIASGSGSVTGTVIVRRYIPSVARRFRFLSSAVQSDSIGDWKNEIYITGSNGNTNNFDSTASNNPSAYYYDESPTTGDLNTGWTAVSNGRSTALTAGKGFRVFVRGDRSDAGRLSGTTTTQNAVTLDLQGTVNSGNITMPVTFTSSGTLANDGWNFVGNPYPSQIDWNAFHDAGRSGSSPDYSGTDYAHLDAIAYIYDAGSNSYVNYNAVSNAGTGTFSTGIIPSGAAFFVKASASSPTMTMKETYKANGAGSAVFKTVSEQQNFRIKMVMDDINSDEMILGFKEDASLGLDGYDIPKMYGGEVNIAAIGADTTYQSVAFKPFNGLYDSIPLSVGIRRSGDYTFQFSNVNVLVPDKYQTISLFDSFAGIYLDLRESAQYTFTADIANHSTWGNTRFSIIIGKIPTPNMGIPQTLGSIHSGKIYLSPTVTDGMVSVYRSKGIEGTLNANITDITGKTVSIYNNLKWDNNEAKMDLGLLQTGVYFIRANVEGLNKTFTFKVIRQ